jgi:signal transduction histidine kinase/CheY-like chemotaxis protein
MGEPPYPLPGGPPDLLGWFVRQLPQCVCGYDGEGRCRLANPALLAWLGRAAHEVLGRSLAELWPGGTGVWEGADLRLLQEGGRIDQIEVRSSAAGDRAVRVVKFPWPVPPGGMVVVFEEAEDTHPAAQGLDPEAVGRMALGIVHDFNNALTLLRGQLSLAEAALAGTPGASPAAALAGVRGVLDHACELPQQLLALVRNEPRVRQRLDLNALLESLGGLLRPRLAALTRLEFDLEPGGAWVEGDPTALTQVLLNLAGNALDAMPQGGRLHVETRRVGWPLAWTPGEGGPAERGSGFFRVTVEDTGRGIPPDLLPRIFEPQVSTKPAGRGTGLGLAIVHEVVRRHGGWVSCHSTVGRGTRFVVHLPAAGPGGDPPAGPGPAGRVLVLERDEGIRRLTALLLEQGPFHAETAPSLAEASGLARAGRFDLLLASEDLCGEADALVRLLAQLPGARLLVTVAGQLPALAPAVAGVLHGLVSKPYSADELLGAVQAALVGRMKDEG